MSECKEIRSPNMQPKSLSKLEKICAQGSCLSDIGFVALVAAAPHVMIVDISWSERVSGVRLQPQSLLKLKELHASHSGLSDVGLAALSEAAPRLRVLFVEPDLVFKLGLPYFRRAFPQLESMNGWPLKPVTQ